MDVMIQNNTYIWQLGFDGRTFDIGVWGFRFRWCQFLFISYPKMNFAPFIGLLKFVAKHSTISYAAYRMQHTTVQ